MATVLELDEVSQPIKIRFVVDRCSIQRDDGSVEPFPAGTELVASIENGSERYTVDGAPVAPDIAAALTLVHSFTSSDGRNDQIFGSEEKKMVGDRWPLDASHSAAGLAELGLPVSESNIRGETSLVEVTNDGKGEVLHIDGRIEIDDLATPDLPGFHVDHASMTVRFTGSFPVDTSRPKLD